MSFNVCTCTCYLYLHHTHTYTTICISPSVIEAGDEPDGEGTVGSAGEMMIDRLRKLNASLNRQLQRQNDKIEQQRRENQR